MAATGEGGRRVSDSASLEAASDAAGGAGCIVFGRISQDGQLIQQVHSDPSGGATSAGAGIVDPIDEAHELDGDGAGTQDYDKISDSSHSKFLL